MKKVMFAVVTSVFLGLGAGAYAIERDAAMLDSAGFQAGRDRGAKLLYVTLWGETALDTDSKNWALVMGLSYGDLLYFGGGSTACDAALGLKYYLTSLTGVSVYGEYGEPVSGGNTKAIYGGTVAIKQRLRPAGDKVSPFIEGIGTLQSVDLPADESGERLVTQGRAGIDFAAGHDLTFVVDAGYAASVDVTHQDEIHDIRAVTCGFAMKYVY